MTSRIFGSIALATTLCHGEKAGSDGSAGCLENPKIVERLEINTPGTYENFLVDSKWQGGNRVKITADNVTLRHCEIRNATGNGIGIFGQNVTIENCRIHHLLAGSFKDQKDAHGITGYWGSVTIRNCEIFYTSGDSVQFDPERKSQGRVVIENCTFWTGPLPEAAAGFHAGETPGENAVDTKVPKIETTRNELIVRNSYFHGWKQPGQIENLAALNLKERIVASVTGCVFSGNQIAFRLRGPGENGGAKVSIADCAIYDGAVGLRLEDKIEHLKVSGLAFGPDVPQRFQMVAGGTGEGFINQGEKAAPPIDERVKPSAAEKSEK